MADNELHEPNSAAPASLPEPGDSWSPDGLARFAVVDTETTGLRSDDRVIEIGVVLLGADLAVEGEWHSLVDPEREMDASWVHKIEAHHVAHAPTFAEIAPEFLGVVHGRVLIAHNYAFDRRMLDGDCRRVGLPTLPNGLCTMRLAGGLSLAKACAHHEIARSVSHEALADAVAAAELFHRLWSALSEAERANQLRRADAVSAPRYDGPTRAHRRVDALALG